jgi:hypothetical protein
MQTKQRDDDLVQHCSATCDSCHTKKIYDELSSHMLKLALLSNWRWSLNGEWLDMCSDTILHGFFLNIKSEVQVPQTYF